MDLFNQIFEKFNKLSYFIAYNITSDSYLAEDVVQETFTKVYQNLKGLSMDTPENTNRTKNFVGIVSKRIALNMVKKNHGELSDIEEEENIPANSEAPAAEFDITDAIARLDPLTADVMNLRYSYDMDIGKIADVTGLGKMAVYKRISRGKKELEQILDEWRWLQ